MSKQQRLVREKRLIERCRAGDDEAWRKFMRRYRRVLFRTVAANLQSHTADANQIDDIVQKVAVKRRLPSSRISRPPAGVPAAIGSEAAAESYCASTPYV